MFELYSLSILVWKTRDNKIVLFIYEIVRVLTDNTSNMKRAFQLMLLEWNEDDENEDSEHDSFFDDEIVEYYDTVISETNIPNN